MSIQNPVKATENFRTIFDPLATSIIVIFGAIWESFVADSWLSGWDGGTIGFALKSFGGFVIAWFFIARIKREWGDEPDSDFRVLLCHYLLVQVRAGVKNEIVRKAYEAIAKSLLRQGVMPPSISQKYIP